MKTALSLAAAACLAASAPTSAQPQATVHEGHRIIPAGELRWSPAPASLPPGAEAATLYGDPSQEGLFVLRIRMPAGYRIPPHRHPRPEILTVLSGTFHLAMGAGSDAPATALSAGSFFALPPGMVHRAHASEETVIQISTTGPWDIVYLDPADDPRRR